MRVSYILRKKPCKITDNHFQEYIGFINSSLDSRTVPLHQTVKLDASVSGVLPFGTGYISVALRELSRSVGVKQRV